MTDEPKEKWRSWKPGWILCLVALYVASVGPACKFCFDYHHSTGPLLVIYRPIFELCRYPFPGKALASYLNLWGSHWRAEYWNPDHGVIIR